MSLSVSPLNFDLTHEYNSLPIATDADNDSDANLKGGDDDAADNERMEASAKKRGAATNGGGETKKPRKRRSKPSKDEDKEKNEGGYESGDSYDSATFKHDDNNPPKYNIRTKLFILNERRTKKCSVSALAQKHKISRSTIYRWINAEPRLKRQSNADSQRVSLSATSSSNRTVEKKFKVEFTIKQKLEIIKECRDNPLTSTKEIAKKHGAQVRCVNQWKKDEEKLKLLVKEDKGHVKRNKNDGLYRVTSLLQHYSDEKASGSEIARKAKEVRDELLEKHKLSPFLNKTEVQALEKFTASSSWGRKLVAKWEGKGWTKKVKTEKEIAALKRKNKSLEKRNEKLKKQNEQLERENGRLKQRAD
jgi:hypothetical protein